MRLNLYQETKEAIRKLMMKELGNNGFHEGIKDDESLTDAGVLDSLGILIVLSILQEHFGITVNPDELDSNDFDTINSLSRFIGMFVYKDAKSK